MTRGTNPFGVFIFATALARYVPTAQRTVTLPITNFVRDLVKVFALTRLPSR